MANIDEVREWLEAEFDYSITAKQWARFKQDCGAAFGDYKAAVSAGDDDDALERISLVWHGWWQKGKGRPAEDSGIKADSGTDPRWTAVTKILTLRSRSDLDVIAFRLEILNDQMIDLDDVSDWIDQTAESDGPSTGFVPDHETRFRLESREFIRYVSDYEGRWVNVKPIRIGERLWRLRSAARRIAQGFGWPEEWMVTFILTDVPPPRPMVFGWTFHWSSSKLPTMDRIELRVNPYAVSPRELETAYRRLRSEKLGLSRVDSMSEKTADLALHWEQTKGQSTGERRAEWNRLHPEWRYTESTGNFGRDARAAHVQATGEGKNA